MFAAMDDPKPESFQQLLESFSLPQTYSALTISVYMLIGGLMAIYVRWLFRTFAVSASDSDSISRVFPLLTLITIGVISIVKTSMALSLGLVGALSIVRFRSAIKEPEELVYLFLCIGLGLMLGTGQPVLALWLLIVASLFVAAMHFMSTKQRLGNTLLTVSGAAVESPETLETTLFQSLRAWNIRHQLQRMDLENGVGQIRLLLIGVPPNHAMNLLGQLRRTLPNCEINLVHLGTNG